MTTETKSVNVVYKFVDGAHFFTSNDPFARGLFAASSDLKAAYDDIPAQIKTLLRVNHGIVDAEVVHDTPFQDFLLSLMRDLDAALVTHRRAGSFPRGVKPRTSATRIKIYELAA